MIASRICPSPPSASHAARAALQVILQERHLAQVVLHWRGLQQRSTNATIESLPNADQSPSARGRYPAQGSIAGHAGEFDSCPAIGSLGATQQTERQHEDGSSAKHAAAQVGHAGNMGARSSAADPSTSLHNQLVDAEKAVVVADEDLQAAQQGLLEASGCVDMQTWSGNELLAYLMLGFKRPALGCHSSRQARPGIDAEDAGQASQVMHAPEHTQAHGRSSVLQQTADAEPLA